MRAVVIAPALAVSVSGCMDHGSGHGAHANLPPAPTLIRPSPRPDSAVPTVAQDLSPDPRIVEVNLTAAPAEHAYLTGKPTAVWAFNGSIPGPTIETK